MANGIADRPENLLEMIFLDVKSSVQVVTNLLNYYTFVRMHVLMPV